ncbi:hypothetical protein D3C81_1818680 [compost metagenome]
MLPQLLAEDLNPAGGRLDQPQQHADGRCFAGAVRSEEPVDFPFPYIQVQMLHRSPAAVDFQ